MKTNKKVTRKMLIEKMELIYRKNVTKGAYHGLCTCYLRACRILFGLRLSPRELRLLPHFVPPSGISWGCWWWVQSDIESRLRYLRALKDLYKDDDTDLVPIVTYYSELYTDQERETFNRELIRGYENQRSA